MQNTLLIGVSPSQTWVHFTIIIHLQYPSDRSRGTEIILDCLGGHDLITSVILRGIREDQSQRRGCDNGSRVVDLNTFHCWLQRWKKGLQAKEGKVLLEAGKAILPWNIQMEHNPWFYSAKTLLDFWTPELEDNKSCCFKSLSLL